MMVCNGANETLLPKKTRQGWTLSGLTHAFRMGAENDGHRRRSDWNERAPHGSGAEVAMKKSSLED
jgi:hypothetical protein